MQLSPTSLQKMTLSHVSSPLLYKDLTRSHQPKHLAMGGVSAPSAQAGAQDQRVTPLQWGSVGTAPSQPWARLCSIYAHHWFTPGETHSLQLRAMLGLTNFINDCKALGEAQTDGSHKVQSDIRAGKMLFGPETSKGVKIPPRARCGARGQPCYALLGTLLWVHLEGKPPNPWLWPR